MIWVVPLTALAVGLLLGGLLMRTGRVALFVALALGLFGIGAWMIVEGRAAEDGWTGIGYAVSALLMAAPCLVGMLAGGALGQWRRRVAAARAGLEASGGPR